MRKLSELLKDHQMFHSKFQQDHLITKRAGGTLYGQYKQSLRELYKRVRGLASDWYQMEKLKNKIKQLQVKEEKLNVQIHELEYIEPHNKTNLTNIEIKELKIKKEKIQLDLKHSIMLLESAERSTKETFRELKRFYSQANYLKDEIEKKYGPLTDKLKEKLDRDMWMYRIKEMCAIDLVYNGRLLNTTYEFLIALPDDMKHEVFQILKEGKVMIEDIKRDLIE